MPATTFGLQYKTGDFFYTIGGDNKSLLGTFPFGNTTDSTNKLIDWANHAANPANPQIQSIVNIFDSQISPVILDPANHFSDTFLPGNMIFNDDFNKLTIDIQGNIDGEGGEDTDTIIPTSQPISGELMMNDNDKAKYDIIDGNIGWSQDEQKNWQPDFTLGADISQKYSFLDSDGVESEITHTTTGKDCKTRKLCTLNHWHYSGTCQANKQTTNTGETSCKCTCTGVPVFNADAHSHCDPYILNSDKTVTTPFGIETLPPNIDFNSTMNKIKLTLNAPFPTVPPLTPGPDGTTSFDYKYNDVDTLNTNDTKIRKAILNYYYEVNLNKEQQVAIQKRGSKELTSKSALRDANVQYKTEYLNVFNIVVGIFSAGGYIYLMSQS